QRRVKWYGLPERLEIAISFHRQLLRVQMREHARYSFSKIVHLRNQAQHQIAVALEIVKVSGMDQHGLLPNQVDGELFIRLRDWNPQDRVPTALDLQAL